MVINRLAVKGEGGAVSTTDGFFNSIIHLHTTRRIIQSAPTQGLSLQMTGRDPQMKNNKIITIIKK